VLRVLKTLFWLVVAVVLVTVGLANRELVELRVLPDALAARVGFLPDLELPLFLVILGAVGIGLLIGFIWEWIREIPERAAARTTARELENLRTELRRHRETSAGGDLVARLELPAVTRR
jgi:uncharacterized integral membrane protein